MDNNPTWERLKTDTEKSFEAFCVYRDLGTNRSLRDVAQKLNKSLTIIGRWSTNHNWVERVSAYDEYMRDKLREQNETMRVQIEADALADYHAVRKAINKRLEILEDVDYTMSPSDLHTLINLMQHANAYARLNSGLPDKIAQTTNTNNNNHSGSVTLLSKLSDEELDDIIDNDDD